MRARTAPHSPRDATLCERSPPRPSARWRARRLAQGGTRNRAARRRIGYARRRRGGVSRSRPPSDCVTIDRENAVILTRIRMRSHAFGSVPPPEDCTAVAGPRRRRIPVPQTQIAISQRRIHRGGARHGDGSLCTPAGRFTNRRRLDQVFEARQRRRSRASAQISFGDPRGTYYVFVRLSLRRRLFRGVHSSVEAWR